MISLKNDHLGLKFKFLGILTTLSCVKVTHFVYSQIPKNASLLGIFPDFSENFQKSSKIIKNHQFEHSRTISKGCFVNFIRINFFHIFSEFRENFKNASLLSTSLLRMTVYVTFGQVNRFSGNS